MILGICNLSIVPVRIVDSDKSEMINQLIYGDIIESLEEKEKWVKIKSVFDDYIGWIDKKQYFKIDNNITVNLDKPVYSVDLVEFIENNNNELVNENEVLSKLIEISVTKDKPIIVTNKNNEKIGFISQSDLLKAVVEGNENE